MNKPQKLKRLEMMNGHRGYEIRPRAQEGDKTSTEVLLFDSVGGWWGIDAEEFVSNLNEITTDEIVVRINSPGGDVFDGLAIFNALKQHNAKVVTRVEGLGASIASIIALAGDTVEIAEAAFFMIHQPWSFAIGNSAEMRETADLLDKIGGTLAEIYMNKTGKTRDEIVDLMDAETWFNGIEAVEAGFVDAIIDAGDEDDADEDIAAAARYDLSAFANAPTSTAPAGQLDSEEPETTEPDEPELEPALDSVAEGADLSDDEAEPEPAEEPAAESRNLARLVKSRERALDLDRRRAKLRGDIGNGPR